MDSIVSILPNIKSWFPLIALLVACLAFIVRRAAKKESTLIELASSDDRAELVEQHFKGRSVNLENLTAQQQYDYAMHDLKGRQKSLTYMFIIAMAAIVLSTVVVYIQGESNTDQPTLADPSKKEINTLRESKAEASQNDSKRPPRPEDFTGENASKRPPRPEDFTGENASKRPPRPEDFTGKNASKRPPRPEDFTGENAPKRPPRPEDFSDKNN